MRFIYTIYRFPRLRLPSHMLQHTPSIHTLFTRTTPPQTHTLYTHMPHTHYTHPASALIARLAPPPRTPPPPLQLLARLLTASAAAAAFLSAASLAFAYLICAAVRTMNSFCAVRRLFCGARASLSGGRGRALPGGARRKARSARGTRATGGIESKGRGEYSLRRRTSSQRG